MMIDSMHKNRGFTLIEVLLAMAIFMFAMMPLIDLGSMLLTQASRRARNMQRMLMAESFMFENRILQRYGQSPKKSKKVPELDTTLTYQTKPVSAELKSFKNVAVEQVIIEWQERGKKRVERLVSFVPKVEGKK